MEIEAASPSIKNLNMKIFKIIERFFEIESISYGKEVFGSKVTILKSEISL